MPLPRSWSQDFWRGEGGGRELLGVAYPLILGHLSFVAQAFIDRLFLAWHSPEAVAGAVTASFTVWVVVSLFNGTGEYLTTFIAQYVGAGRPERVGPALWQGLYFVVASGLVLAAMAPLAEPVFRLAGHPPVVRGYEVAYARLMLLGGFSFVALATLSTFFAGRGKTRTVLMVNVLAAVVDIPLDYALIFGKWGFPEMGVEGAVIASLVGEIVAVLAMLAIVFRPKYRAAYATVRGWRFEPALFVRLVRFGLPAGLQYSLEILAFAVFMMIIGRIGTAELAASSVAFNFNLIVFMPMVGLATAVSSLVGRYLGANRPDVAERSVYRALAVSLSYMTLCGLLYVGAPRLLLAPYYGGADPAGFAAIEPIATVLLRFVAVYSIFDAMNLVFAAGLKGAGDTLYPLGLTIGLSWALLLGPSYWFCVVGDAGVYTAWTAASAYVVVLGVLMWRRFRGGRWRAMRVIEDAPAV